MKKICIICLIIVLVFGICGCNDIAENQLIETESIDKSEQIITNLKEKYNTVDYGDALNSKDIKFSVDIVDMYKGKRILLRDFIAGWYNPDIIYQGSQKVLIMYEDDNFEIKLNEEHYNKIKETALNASQKEKVYDIYIVFELEDVVNCPTVNGCFDFYASSDDLEIGDESTDVTFDSRVIKGTLVDLIVSETQH